MTRKSERGNDSNTGIQSREIPLWEPSPSLIDVLSHQINKPIPQPLLTELSIIGMRYYQNRMFVDERPKYSEAREELETISDLARDLEKALHQSNLLTLAMLYDFALTQNEPRPYPFIDKLVSDLETLASWAEGGLDALKKSPKTAGGRPNLFADGQLALELGKFYEELTGKRPTAPSHNSDTGKWQSTFFRFYVIIYQAFNNTDDDTELKKAQLERRLAAIVKKALRKSNSSQEAAGQ